MAEFFNHPSSQWPWVRFSDGTELSNGSRIWARSMKNFSAERSNGHPPRTIKAGERVLVIMKGRDLIMAKPGTGNRNKWHEIAAKVVEGVDFSLINGKALVEFDEHEWRKTLKPLFPWEG